MALQALRRPPRASSAGAWRSAPSPGRRWRRRPRWPPCRARRGCWRRGIRPPPPASVGMLAPSATHDAAVRRAASWRPRRRSRSAVAQGSATSHGHVPGPLSVEVTRRRTCSAYSRMRPRRSFFSSITQASFSASMPSGSNDRAVRVGERDRPCRRAGCTFSTAYCATLPEPETAHALAREGLAARLEHLLGEVDRAVAGRLGADQRAAPAEPFAGEHAGELVAPASCTGRRGSRSRARRRRCRRPARRCSVRCGGTARS